MESCYLSHCAEDGRQESVLQHLQETAIMAEGFAAAFGAGPQGYLAGLMHDIGKYSDAFQARLQGNPHRVDHSTAGAWETWQMHQSFACFAIAGHHGGLPDGGCLTDTSDQSTFVKAALNCGQVRGPVQLGFARSVEPVYPQEVTITRVSITTEADAEKKDSEMGRKYIVPYGLYRCEGYISANLAHKTTGFSEDDLALLWEAILNMFENDHSAARGKMAVRELIIFKHDTELGCAPAWKLFDTVHIERTDPNDHAPARSYKDYTVTVDEASIPAGVHCTRMV